MERIALIGYRGSGKSTVGPLAAAALGWVFADADARLEAKAGRSIAEIFKADGEAAFRDLEENNLRELLLEDRIVIATGGGVVLRESNRLALRSKAFTVWLKADARLCWQRIQADATSEARRPNLAGGGLEEVQAMLREREPIYRDAANLVLDGARPAGELAEEIAAAWKAR